MESTRIALNALLQQSPPQEKEALGRFINPIEKQVLDRHPRTNGNPLRDVETTEKTLARIHPSWIPPFLRNLSEKEIGFFLACLDPLQAKVAAKELSYTSALPRISEMARHYLQQTLLGYLAAEIDDLLPISWLPESPLNSVLEIDNERFNLLLDFLGLHDLSIEIKQIIDKNQLSKIHKGLTSAQLNYLTMLQQSSEPVVFGKMGLSHWDGDPEKIKNLIRQRGANRLAKALHGQNPSLIWYILHKLDIGSALLAHKLLAPMENSRAAQLLIQQILEFFSFIGSHE